MNRRHLPAAFLLAIVGVALTPAPAAAHPLGNFTTNQYAGLRVSGTGVDVDYVLDLAELPAYQARTDEIDTDGSGAVSDLESNRYAGSTCAAVGAASTVTFDGRVAAVTARPVALTFPAGAGGLTTLRLQCVLHADGRPVDDTTIGYRDDYLPDRIGWREVTAVGDHYTLTRSDVPSATVSGRLTAYPVGAPTSDVRTAALTVRTGGPAAAPFAGSAAAAEPQARGADRLTRWFTDLVGHPRLTWGVGILAFLVAFVLGGAHAVAPGHGKTIMAAYLVGARGRMSQALTVAATVAATHTLGVLALGVVLATSLTLAPQHLYEWLRLVSGVLVAAVGAQLLRGALRGVRARRFAGHAEALAHIEHTHAAESRAEHAEVGGGHSHSIAHGHAHATDGPTHADHTHADHSHADHSHADHSHAAAEHSHDDHDSTGHSHGEHLHATTGHSHDDHNSTGHSHGDHVHATTGHDHGHEDDDHSSHDHDHGSGGHDRVSGDHRHVHAELGHAEVALLEHGHDHPGHAADVAAAPHSHPHVVAGEPHSHGGGRPHTHYLPAPDEPFRLRTLLAMGFAGGLSPSPSAVVVLLGAVALGRAWYGVVLVLAYGIGLAAVLTGIGLALARWGERLHAVGSGRFARLLTHRLPTVTAAAILAVGVGMAALAISSLLTTTG